MVAIVVTSLFGPSRARACHLQVPAAPVARKIFARLAGTGEQADVVLVVGAGK